jgi:opacity protein-like surface antigen
MKKILIIFTVLAFATGMAQGQEKPASSLGYSPRSYYTFSWNITFPMGDFHDWVKETGLAGFDIGGRYFIKGGLAAGFNISWDRVATEYSDGTFTIPDKGIAITATNYRFTWMVPFQAVIAYHLNPGKMVSPYVGLGIGGDYMEHHLMIQEYDIYKERWDFSLTPEIGVLAKFGNFSNWGALVAFNYKWTTNQIEFYEKSSKNLQMLNLKVGLAYIIR